MDPYRYSPLSTKPGTIRLLRLKPSSNKDADIECDLYDYCLEIEDQKTSHSYEALSYVWGDRTVQHGILINDCEFQVWANLHAALLHLRNHRFDRILWIDAICINQDDDEEKPRQIQYMREVYGRADRVIVWLGVEGNGSSQAQECIEMAAEAEPSEGDSVLAVAKEQKEACLVLLQREWFERIWVLQEVGAARDVHIMCGHERISGFTFSTGLANLQLDFEDHPGLVNLVSSITYLIRRAIFRPRHRVDFGQLPLGQLVDMYHDRKATISHDRVYALLGLSSDPNPQQLLSGYQLSWSLFWQQFIKYVLTDNVSVETWDDGEVAVITATGDALGYVESVTVKGSDSRADRQFVDIIFSQQDQPSDRGCRVNNPVRWKLPISAKSIQQDDIIFLFQGCKSPSIIRACRDYFITIMLDATPQATAGRAPSIPRPLKSPSMFTHKYPTFRAVWDWRALPPKQRQQESAHQPSTYLSDTLPQYPKSQALGTVWLGGMADPFINAGKPNEAAERFQEIVLYFEKTLGPKCPQTLASLHDLAQVYRKAKIGEALRKSQYES